ncbi:MAG: WhiB family transcriptional regulator [Acidimicrobiia bacterium]|jgi:WhiB family redox-sensing transcriptional regulator|nr:MAG: WhiB family transcriptional regulator [Acidimicrobiia bacterium]
MEMLRDDDQAWRLEAACADLTSEEFFLAGDDLEGMRRAQAVCAGCPVKAECLEFALASNQSLGIWGGTTPNERRRLRREWLRKAS